MMRILHFTKNLPPFHGGLERVTSTMADAGVALGASVELVGNQRSGTAPSTGISRLTAVPLLGDFGPVPIAPGFLAMFDRYRQADVVHLHLPNPFAELAILSFLARLPPGMGPRLIPVLHAPIQRFPLLAGMWETVVHGALLRRADAIVTTSPQLMSINPRWTTFVGKAVVLPPAVDDPLPHQIRPVPPKLGTAILAIGRLVPYKGFDLLLQALAQVPGATLDLVGDGPLRAQLVGLADSLGVAGRVRFHGAVEESLKRELLAGCDLFVLPSRSNAECYGVVIAEAFSHGCPVVATGLQTGVAFLARDGACGGVAVPGSAASLAEELGRLIQNKALRRQAGEANRLFFEQELTHERFLDRYAELIRSSRNQGGPLDVSPAKPTFGLNVG